MSFLIEHLERHLGPIVSGWSHDANKRSLPFQIVLLQTSPIAGAQVLATLGLSNTLLRVGNTSRRLRQELMFMFRTADGARNLPGILQQLGTEALAKNQAYGVGEVIGPRGELRVGSSMEALYVAPPVYLPDSFHVCRPTDGEPIVMGWLAPISASEAEFVRVHSASRFEDELARHDPDLLDFERQPIA